MADNQIIELGWDKKVFYEYATPSIPNEKDIAGYRLSKKEQYWRNVCPKFPIYKYMSALEKENFVRKQKERMMYGFWFMNNGEPTYITGLNYQHLATNVFKGAPNRGILDYRVQQRNNFYFKDLVRKDANCYGDITIKGRRIGSSQERLSESLDVATMGSEMFVGLVAQTKDDAFNILYNPIAHVLRNRHPLLKPIFYAPHGTLPKGGLVFDNSRLDNEENGIEVLGSDILVGATTTKVFDGYKKHLIIFDECLKLNISLDEILETHKPCVVDNGEMIGKLSFVSTLGTDEKTMGLAIKEGLAIWAESDPLIRNDNNFTHSGLYKYFIPYHKSHGKFFDKYGNCDEEKALESIYNQRAKFERNSPDYIKEIRKFPISEEEVIGMTSLRTTFNAIKITSRHQKLDSLPTPAKPYVKGHLIENPLTGLVEFVVDITGKWKVSVRPHVKARNRVIKTNVGYKPYKDSEFCIGVDPVSWARTTSTKVSKQSIMVLKKYAFDWNDEDSDVVLNDFRFAALYNSREDTPSETHKQALLAARYWGAPVMVERNVTSQIQLFESEGMYQFLQSSEDDNEVGTHTTTKSTEKGVTLIQEFILRDAKDKSMIDYLSDDHKYEHYDKAIPFEELLQQLKYFDIKKTREYDVVMSLIMALFSLEQLKPIRYNANRENPMRDILNTLNSAHA